MNVSLSDEATADLLAAADWYMDDGAWTAAQDLRREVDQALGRLAYAPGVGTRGPSNTRILPVHRFPYSLIYRRQGDTVRVIAIAHQSRAQGYWANRR